MGFEELYQGAQSLQLDFLVSGEGGGARMSLTGDEFFRVERGDPLELVVFQMGLTLRGRKGPFDVSVLFTHLGREKGSPLKAAPTNIADGKGSDCSEGF